VDIRSIESITALHSAGVQQQLDTAVLAKANDLAKAQGDMALKLLEVAAATSAQPAGTSRLPHGMDLVA